MVLQAFQAASASVALTKILVYAVTGGLPRRTRRKPGDGTYTTVALEWTGSVTVGQAVSQSAASGIRLFDCFVI